MNAFTSDFASKLSRFPKWKEPAFQHPHYLFVQKKSQNSRWKCSAHEGIVFIDCIFTSPEASLSNASQPFALHAFYSNSNFTAGTCSPFHLLCNGVQHSWNATQWCNRVCSLWRPESVQDKFVACWCSSHSCIPPFSFVSAGGYPLQCQPVLPPTTANSALCSSLLCNYRSSSVDVRIEVSWSILQLWFQKEVVLEWSQHYI